MNVTGESKCFVSPSARSLAARGQLPFCFAKKVTQKGDPKIRPDPAVLATGGTKTNRPMARCRARWAHGFGLGPPVAPLLGVEYTGTPSDGCLIALRWGLREPGREHPGYVVACAVIPVEIRYKRVPLRNSTTCVMGWQMTMCAIKRLYARRLHRSHQVSPMASATAWK